jgi:hypothetical protein
MCPPSASSSPSAEERRQIRYFVRLVEDMLQSRFYHCISEMDHSVSCDFSSEGRSQLTTPDYDWEDFRSFLTSFRQIALNERDAVYVYTIRNIISRFADPRFRNDLRAVRAHLTAVLSGNRRPVFLGVRTEAGEVQLSGAGLLDALVNGELFHSDADYEQILQQLGTLPCGSYLWIVLFDVILPVLHACWHLVKVILNSNLLPSEDLPARLRESWERWCRDHPPVSSG